MNEKEKLEKGVEERNAMIVSADLVIERDVLTVLLSLDYGDNTSQCFGGFALAPAENSREAGYFLWRIMNVVGVAKWSELAGKNVRVLYEQEKVHAIGHIIKDDWFYVSIPKMGASKSQ